MFKSVKLFLLLSIVTSINIYGQKITPNEVYSQVSLISNEVHSLISYYNVQHDDAVIRKETKVLVDLKPRNVWQKSYEIMIKINILRNIHNLPTIEPVNMSPILDLNPDLVYEQTQRILTELKIFKLRMRIPSIPSKVKKFKNKTPMDVFNGLSYISASLDILNKGGLTPSFVFAENMRVYDDISLILEFLEIEDNTIPNLKNENATPNDTFNTALKILKTIKYLQIKVGIDFVDFNGFKKAKITPSNVFSLTQMILSELQTIKAYIGLPVITVAAGQYKTKTPIEVDQLMSWNLRKLNLIQSIYKAK